MGSRRRRSGDPRSSGWRSPPNEALQPAALPHSVLPARAPGAGVVCGAPCGGLAGRVAAAEERTRLAGGLGFTTGSYIAVNTGSGSIDVAVNNSSVHMDVSELIVHIIMIPGIDEPSVGSDPAPAVPSVVIRAGPVPVPVAVQPRADGEAGAE